MEEVMSQSKTVHNYLAHLYSYLPCDEEMQNLDGWVSARSDEAMFSWYQWVYYLLYRTGNYSSATPASGGASNPYRYFDFWPKYYIAINQCSIFMQNLKYDEEDTPKVKSYMMAEARFLRVFYYFTLFRQYGPVYIWGDNVSDDGIDATKVDRNTVEENFKFMLDELEICIRGNESNDPLPIDISDSGENGSSWMGRATRGAAMALKARILLWAASPLYNGCDLYKGQMINNNGQPLFPQSHDPEKWTAAAQAFKEIIDMNKYSLCTSDKTSDEFVNAADAYLRVFQDPWNEETIWGWWKRTFSGYSSYLGGSGAALACAGPRDIVFAGYGGVCPSLKLVDSYAMYESGRYPVTAYKKSAGKNDYSAPIIDDASGYVADGFTDEYKQPYGADWAPAFKAHNSCVGREPRYYACVVPNGFYWPDVNVNKRCLFYNSSEATSMWKSSGDAIRVGYAWRKWNPNNYSLKTYADYMNIKQVYPAFRMAEVYLGYAEACNEMPQRNPEEALKYINLVRARAGLNTIQEAYPEKGTDQEFIRWCIRQEKMIEFGLEATRHYDACRWMVAKDEYPSANWTLHLSAKTYEESWTRVSTDFVGDPAVFEDRDYLFPLSSDELAEMPNVTQNYGF